MQALIPGKGGGDLFMVTDRAIYERLELLREETR